MAKSTFLPDLPEKALFRPDEVAEICSVTVRTVYNWHGEGKIEAIKLTPSCLRFSRTSLIKFLKTTT